MGVIVGVMGGSNCGQVRRTGVMETGVVLVS